MAPRRAKDHPLLNFLWSNLLSQPLSHFYLGRLLLSQDPHRIKTSDNAPASLLSFKSKLRSRTPRTRTRSAIQSASLLGFGAARMSRFDRRGPFGSGRMKKLPCPDLIHLLSYEITPFEFKPAYFAVKNPHTPCVSPPTCAFHFSFLQRVTTYS